MRGKGGKMKEKIKQISFLAVLALLIGVWVFISCREIKNTITDVQQENAKVQVMVYVGQENKSYKIDAESEITALSALLSTGLETEVKMYGSDALVTKIAGDSGNGQIWYTKNGQLVMQAANKTKVEPGDKIEWYVYPNKP
jgi:competence protein ComGC